MRAVEAKIRNKETPPTFGADAADRWFKPLDLLVRAKIGLMVWVRRSEMGLVQSINAPAHRAQVSVPSDTEPGTGSPGPHSVHTGSGSPEPKKRYRVDFPFRLADSPASVLRGPVPYLDPWMKVPAGKRWLYRKSRGNSELVRYAWPPPGVGEDWLPEMVNDNVRSDSVLLGGSTPAGKATEIVVVESVPNEGTLEGQEPMLASRDHCYHYADMGFGSVSHDWTAAPTFVHVDQIANDGIATSGHNNSYAKYVQVEFNGVQQPELPDEIDSEYDCSLACPPLGVLNAHITNYKPVWVLRVFKSDPAFFNLAVKGWVGQLGALSQVVVSQTHWFLRRIDFGSSPHYAARINCVGSGCHCSFPPILFWDSYECVTKWFAGPDFYEVVLKRDGRTVSAVDALLSYGCWQYGGLPSAAYVWSDLKVAPLDGGAEAFSDPRTWLQGVGCNPSSKTDITASGVIVTHAALTPDTSSLVLWGIRRSGFLTNAMKWEGSWKAVPAITQVLVLSRDGTDALAEGAGGHYFTLDSGETWTPCATLPEFFFPGIRQAVRFVDEIA